METQTIESGKYTGVLHDLIDIFIEHNFTVKEAQIFLQSPDILSDMMQQFMAWDRDVTRFAKVMPGTEDLLWFIKERYPTYGFLLDSMDRGEIDQIFFSPMQRKEIYDQYTRWFPTFKQIRRSFSRTRFYEILQSLNFRIRHDLKNKDQNLMKPRR